MKVFEELPAPPVLVYLDWDAVAANSRPFLLYCDASVKAMAVESVTPGLCMNPSISRFG